MSLIIRKALTKSNRCKTDEEEIEGSKVIPIVFPNKEYPSARADPHDK